MAIYDEIISGRYFEDPAFVQALQQRNRDDAQHQRNLELQDRQDNRAVQLANLNNTAADDRLTRQLQDHRRLSIELAGIREAGDINVEQLRQAGRKKEVDEAEGRIDGAQAQVYIKAGIARKEGESVKDYVVRAGEVHAANELKLDESLAKSIADGEAKVEGLGKDAIKLEQEWRDNANAQVQKVGMSSALAIMDPHFARKLQAGQPFESVMTELWKRNPSNAQMVQSRMEKAVTEAQATLRMPDDVRSRVSMLREQAKGLDGNLTSMQRVMANRPKAIESFLNLKAELFKPDNATAPISVADLMAPSAPTQPPPTNSMMDQQAQESQPVTDAFPVVSNQSLGPLKQASLKRDLYNQLTALADKNQRFGAANLKTGLTRPTQGAFSSTEDNMRKLAADLVDLQGGNRSVFGQPVRIPQQDSEAMLNIIDVLLRDKIPSNPGYE